MEEMQRQASSSSTDIPQADMDLEKALKIVSKHYVTRNTTSFTFALVRCSQHLAHRNCSACKCKAAQAGLLVATPAQTVPSMHHTKIVCRAHASTGLSALLPGTPA